MSWKGEGVPKLNQIIAIEKGEQTRAAHILTGAYHLLEKSALLQGHTRTYRPRDAEDPDQPPDDNALVQVKCDELTPQVRDGLTRYYDIAATRDWANAEARADVVIDGKVLLPAVPVTYLLFLEKQLVNLHTYLSKLPILDPAQVWQYDGVNGCYRTTPVETVRNKKVKRVLTLAPPTDKHPAQVQVYEEDVPVGNWLKTSFSGAMERDRVKELVRRVEALQTAVKFAREEANSREVKPVAVGKTIFDYVLAP